MIEGVAPDSVTPAMASSKAGFFVGERIGIVPGGRSPGRELGGEGFVLGGFVLDTDGRCLSEGGGEWPCSCASTVTFDTALEVMALGIEARRSPELRRDRVASNSTSLREGELRDEGDLDFSA
jgi:hypothetical protein